MSTSTSSSWNDLSASVIETIEQAIHQANEQLRSVSLDIHAHPELGWEEHHAHDALTAWMEKQGFEVERHAYGLQTAWKATYENGQGGRTIGFNSESEQDD
jgi:metal-dependent amidase/aminoacylase/carboxypeptidase family protein